MTIEILSRLPVKSLLRFKSVCKTWYDLIKTHDFISKHLQTHSTLNSTSLLVTNYNCETETHQISLLSNDGLSNGPINLDFPFLNGRIYVCTGVNDFSIVGICNGLVCISLSPLGYPLILCNPSTTRQFREIPGAEWDWDDENMLYVRQVSFGFGFHYSANDYKLIRIVSYTSPTGRNDIRADLYVMSTDTWTEIDVTKFSLFFGEKNENGGYDTIGRFASSSTSALLNGVFYRPATAVQTDQVVVVVVVMSFDMGNEVFGRIRTPACLDRTWCGANLQCMELNDKLALVVSPDERGFDVWVLNEIESSWTHQVKVESFPRIASDMGNGEYSKITVVGGLKNGELLVTGHNLPGELKLFSSDTNTRETMDLYFVHVSHESCVYLYSGTLLPVMKANEIVLDKWNKKRKAYNFADQLV
ncbi:hypothetical protein RHMOL_Rhmol05G0301300 [Rhododendron molle]|uniref:Uncharacterized protein n=1 Tax=Rhododendron molle TaxID=49168 RepID=A0ACC0NUI3_RHOML|nr:hypothetical protein RHMOL_Rhmol05G0301300 [Rhododendron molle]